LNDLFTTDNRSIKGSETMSSIRTLWLGLLLSFATVIAANVPSVAQQVTGVAGSPSATTTIGGQQLLPLPQRFEGKIERNAAQSTPYWPARVVPPEGAPNVLLIMPTIPASASPARSAA
jgi:arylsulfatase